MKISIVFHLIGMVMWVGGLLFYTWLKSRAAKKGEEIGDLSKMITSFIMPGMIIMLFTGMYQVMHNNRAFYYLSQGWFHTKLTLVLFLLIATFWVSKDIYYKEGSLDRGRLRKQALTQHRFAGLLLLLIVAVTILGR